jgi:Na+/H+-translocating membrane pyrophosphatase
VLAGGLVSGVQMAVSMSNTGGAWDNAKKYIEAGASEHARDLGGKGSDCHKARGMVLLGGPAAAAGPPAPNLAHRTRLQLPRLCCSHLTSP